MNIRFYLLTILVAHCLFFMACAQNVTYDLAIQNVELFDPINKVVLKGKTILISADTIADVIEAKTFFKAKKTIQGNGRLVTPGFIDTHMHTLQMYEVLNDFAPNELTVDRVALIKRMLKQQFLAYGTTTIIDMGQPESWVEETIGWQKNPSNDLPNYFINGSSIISDEKRTPAQHHREVQNPEDAKKKVQYYASLGLKYMKLYSRLRKPEMEAIIEEAQKHGITLNAHVDNNIVTIPEAMDLGVRNFEHFFTLIPSVIEYNEHWVKCDEKYDLKGIRSIDDWTAQMIYFFDYINGLPEAKQALEQLFDRMVQEEATLSTALHVLSASAGKTDFFTSFNHFPIREKPLLEGYTREQHLKLDGAFNTFLEFIKMAHTKGVKLRIGTDCRYGGRAMLSEMKLLFEAGLRVEDILQIATINGADAMKISDRFGSIEVGKQADLVIFEKSPFKDYQNFLSDRVVIKGGKEIQFKTSVAYALLDIIIKKGKTEGMDWFRSNRNAEGYDYQIDEMFQVAFDLMASNRENEGMEIIKMNLAENPASKKYLLEASINAAGYKLMGREEIAAAIELLKFNVHYFPDSWNVYDSMGEAYMVHGNTELAIEFYEKSIELNPENTFGIEALKKLKSK